MKRAKRLYTLLGILAVVSVLTFCVLNYQEKQEEIKASGEVVLSIDPEEVTAFSWEYEALDPLSFHKDESWTYDEDSTFPVDEGQITSLLEQFRNFSAAFIIEDVTDYGQYGLDDPICTIHITAGDTDYEILAGQLQHYGFPAVCVHRGRECLPGVQRPAQLLQLYHPGPHRQ